MSLIDDALKKAQGSQTPPPPATLAYAPPPLRRPPPTQSHTKFLLGLLALAFIVVVVYYASPTKKIVAEKKPGATPSVKSSAAPASRTIPTPTAEAPKKQTLVESFMQPPPKINGKTETTTTLASPAETPKPEEPKSEEPTLPNLRLDGIVVSATKGKQALINGVPVHEGDTVSGATVMEIEKERVKLSFQTKEIVLSFP